MTPGVPSGGSSTWIQELLEKTAFPSPRQPGKSWEADPSLRKGHHSMTDPGKCSTEKGQNREFLGVQKCLELGDQCLSSALGIEGHGSRERVKKCGMLK